MDNTERMSLLRGQGQDHDASWGEVVYWAGWLMCLLGRLLFHFAQPILFSSLLRILRIVWPGKTEEILS